MEDLQTLLPVIPTDAQAVAIAEIVSEGTLFAQAIVKALPEGTEQAIAINGVKTAIMWASHGILKQPKVELCGV